MTREPASVREGADHLSAAGGRWAMLRWLLSYGTFGVPQAAGPIAFALLVLPLTGSPRGGAALVLAVTVAQLVGAVPVARLGRGRNAVAFLRALVAVRTVALAGVAGLAAGGAPFGSLLAGAALAGLVNGAAFGYLRSILNHLVEPSRMPRALGLASTLGEFTFVAAPVLASTLGTVDPVFALLFLTVLGATPVLLLPGVSHAGALARAAGGGGRLTPAVLPWLGCVLANSAAVSSIEVGAVSLATRYGFEPAQGFVFTLALCGASVAGGIWVSARNRALGRRAVLACLFAMLAGTVLVAAGPSVATTLAGAAVVGGVLAPLGTFYSLQLDTLSPAHRRAEVFALSRTATSLGIILTSTTLALFSLAAAQAVAAAVVCAALVAAALARPGGAVAPPR